MTHGRSLCSLYVQDLPEDEESGGREERNEGDGEDLRRGRGRGGSVFQRLNRALIWRSASAYKKII